MQNGWIPSNNPIYANRIAKCRWFICTLLLGLALAGVNACSRHNLSGNHHPPHTLKTYQSDYDDVWSATVNVINGRNQIPLKHVDKNTGFLTSDWVRENRTIEFKDQNMTATVPTRYRLNVKLHKGINTQAAKVEEQITVTINKQFQYKQGKKWQTLTSDRQLESEILAGISKELNQ